MKLTEKFQAIIMVRATTGPAGAANMPMQYSTEWCDSYAEALADIERIQTAFHARPEHDETCYRMSVPMSAKKRSLAPIVEPVPTPRPHCGLFKKLRDARDEQ